MEDEDDTEEVVQLNTSWYRKDDSSAPGTSHEDHGKESPFAEFGCGVAMDGGPQYLIPQDSPFAGIKLISSSAPFYAPDGRKTVTVQMDVGAGRRAEANVQVFREWVHNPTGDSSGGVKIEEEEPQDKPAYNPSDEDILEYAKFLGIEEGEEGEESLMDIARIGIVAPLPEGWVACQDDDEEIFYFNTVTQESVWDHPSDAHFKAEVEKERARLAAKKGTTKEKQEDTKKEKPKEDEEQEQEPEVTQAKSPEKLKKEEAVAFADDEVVILSDEDSPRDGDTLNGGERINGFKSSVASPPQSPIDDFATALHKSIQQPLEVFEILGMETVTEWGAAPMEFKLVALEAKVKNLHQELTKQSEFGEARLNDCEMQLESTQEQLQETIGMLEVVEAQAQQYKAEANRVAAQAVQLDNQLESLLSSKDAEVQEREAALDNALAEQEALMETMQTMETQNDELTKMLRNERSTSDGLITERDELLEQVAMLEVEVANIRTGTAASLDGRTSTHSELMEEIEHLKTELAQAKANAAQVEGDSSIVMSLNPLVYEEEGEEGGGLNSAKSAPAHPTLKTGHVHPGVEAGDSAAQEVISRLAAQLEEQVQEKRILLQRTVALQHTVDTLQATQTDSRKKQEEDEEYPEDWDDWDEDESERGVSDSKSNGRGALSNGVSSSGADQQFKETDKDAIVTQLQSRNRELEQELHRETGAVLELSKLLAQTQSLLENNSKLDDSFKENAKPVSPLNPRVPCMTPGNDSDVGSETTDDRRSEAPMTPQSFGPLLGSEVPDTPQDAEDLPRYCTQLKEQLEREKMRQEELLEKAASALMKKESEMESRVCELESQLRCEASEREALLEKAGIALVRKEEEWDLRMQELQDEMEAEREAWAEREEGMMEEHAQQREQLEEKIIALGEGREAAETALARSMETSLHQAAKSETQLAQLRGQVDASHREQLSEEAEELRRAREELEAELEELRQTHEREVQELKEQAGEAINTLEIQAAHGRSGIEEELGRVKEEWQAAQRDWQMQAVQQSEDAHTAEEAVSRAERELRESLEQQLAEYKTDLEDIEERLIQSQVDFKEAESELKSTKEELEALQEEQKGQAATFEQTRQVLLEEVAVAGDRVESLEKELESRKEVSNALEAEKSELSERCKKLRLELEELEMYKQEVALPRIASLEEQSGVLEGKWEAAVSELRSAEEQVSELQRGETTAAEERDWLKRELVASADQEQQVGDRVLVLEGEVGAAREEAAAQGEEEARRIREELEDRVRQVEEQRERAMQDLEAAVQAQGERSESHASEVDNLKEKLSSETAAAEALQAETRELQQGLAMAQEEVRLESEAAQEAQSEVERLTGDFLEARVQAQQQIQQYQSEVSALESSLGEVRHESEVQGGEAEQRLAELEAQLEDRLYSLNLIQGQCEEMEVERVAAIGEVEALQQSLEEEREARTSSQAAWDQHRDQLQAELHTQTQEALGDLERTKKELEDSKEGAVSKLEIQISELTAKQLQLEEEREQLEKDVEEARREKDRTHAEAEERQATLTGEVDLQRDELTQAEAAAARERELTLREVEVAKQAQEVLHSRNEALEGMNCELQELLERNSGLRDAMQDSHTGLEGEVEELKGVVQSLEAQLAAVRQDAETAQTDFAATLIESQDKLSQTLERQLEVQETLAKAQARLKEEEGQVEEAWRQVAAEVEKSEGLTARVGELEERGQDLQAAESNAVVLQMELQEQVQAARSQIKELEEDLSTALGECWASACQTEITHVYELKHCKAENAAATIQIAAMQETLEGLRQEFSLKDTESVTLRSDLERRAGELEVLQRANQEALEFVTELQASSEVELERFRSELNAQTSALEASREDNSQLNLKLLEAEEGREEAVASLTSQLEAEIVASQEAREVERQHRVSCGQLEKMRRASREKAEQIMSRLNAEASAARETEEEYEALKMQFQEMERSKETSIQELRDQLSAETSALAGAQSKIGSLENQLESLHQCRDEDVQGVESRLLEQVSALEVAKESESLLKDQIEGIKRGRDEAIAEITAQLNLKVSALEEASARVRDVEEGLESVEMSRKEETERMKARLDAEASALSGSEEARAGLEVQLEEARRSHEEELERISSQYQAEVSAHTEAQAKMCTLETQLQELKISREQNVQEAESKLVLETECVQQAQARIQAIETELEELQAARKEDLLEVESQLHTKSSALEEARAHVQTLERQVEELHLTREGDIHEVATQLHQETSACEKARRTSIELKSQLQQLEACQAEEEASASVQFEEQVAALKEAHEATKELESQLEQLRGAQEIESQLEVEVAACKSLEDCKLKLDLQIEDLKKSRANDLKEFETQFQLKASDLEEAQDKVRELTKQLEELRNHQGAIVSSSDSTSERTPATDTGLEGTPGVEVSVSKSPSNDSVVELPSDFPSEELGRLAARMNLDANEPRPEEIGNRNQAAVSESKEGSPIASIEAAQKQIKELKKKAREFKSREADLAEELQKSQEMLEVLELKQKELVESNAAAVLNLEMQISDLKAEQRSEAVDSEPTASILESKDPPEPSPSFELEEEVNSLRDLVKVLEGKVEKEQELRFQSQGELQLAVAESQDNLSKALEKQLELQSALQDAEGKLSMGEMELGEARKQLSAETERSEGLESSLKELEDLKLRAEESVAGVRVAEQTLAQQLQELEAELSESRDRAARLQDDSSESARKMEELHQLAMSTVKDEHAEAQAQLTNLQSTYEALQQELAAKSSELTEASTSLQSKESEVEALQLEVAQACRRLKELQASSERDIQALTSQLSTQAAALQATRQAHLQLQDHLKTLEASKDEDFAAVSSKLQAEFSALVEAQETIQGLEREREDLILARDNAVREAEDRVREEAQQLEAAQNVVKEMEETVTRCAAHETQLVLQLQQCKEELGLGEEAREQARREAEEEEARLKSQLGQLTAELQEAYSTDRARQEELEGARRDNQSLRQSEAHLAAAVERERAEVRGILREGAEASGRAAALETEVKELRGARQQAMQAGGELVALDASLATWREAANALAHKEKELKRQLKELEQSAEDRERALSESLRENQSLVNQHAEIQVKFTALETQLKQEKAKYEDLKLIQSKGSNNTRALEVAMAEKDRELEHARASSLAVTAELEVQLAQLADLRAAGEKASGLVLEERDDKRTLLERFVERERELLSEISTVSEELKSTKARLTANAIASSAPDGGDEDDPVTVSGLLEIKSQLDARVAELRNRCGDLESALQQERELARTEECTVQELSQQLADIHRGVEISGGERMEISGGDASQECGEKPEADEGDEEDEDSGGEDSEVARLAASLAEVLEEKMQLQIRVASLERTESLHRPMQRGMGATSPVEGISGVGTGGGGEESEELRREVQEEDVLRLEEELAEERSTRESLEASHAIMQAELSRLQSEESVVQSGQIVSELAAARRQVASEVAECVALKEERAELMLRSVRLAAALGEERDGFQQRLQASDLALQQMQAKVQTGELRLGAVDLWAREVEAMARKEVGELEQKLQQKEALVEALRAHNTALQNNVTQVLGQLGSLVTPARGSVAQRTAYSPEAASRSGAAWDHSTQDVSNDPSQSFRGGPAPQLSPRQEGIQRVMSQLQTTVGAHPSPNGSDLHHVPLQTAIVAAAPAHSSVMYPNTASQQPRSPLEYALDGDREQGIAQVMARLEKEGHQQPRTSLVQHINPQSELQFGLQQQQRQESLSRRSSQSHGPQRQTPVQSPREMERDEGLQRALVQLQRDPYQHQHIGSHSSSEIQLNPFPALVSTSQPLHHHHHQPESRSLQQTAKSPREMEREEGLQRALVQRHRDQHALNPSEIEFDTIPSKREYDQTEETAQRKRHAASVDQGLPWLSPQERTFIEDPSTSHHPSRPTFHEQGGLYGAGKRRAWPAEGEDDLDQTSASKMKIRRSEDSALRGPSSRQGSTHSHSPPETATTVSLHAHQDSGPEHPSEQTPETPKMTLRQFMRNNFVSPEPPSSMHLSPPTRTPFERDASPRRDAKVRKQRKNPEWSPRTLDKPAPFFPNAIPTNQPVLPERKKTQGEAAVADRAREHRTRNSQDRHHTSLLQPPVAIPELPSKHRHHSTSTHVQPDPPNVKRSNRSDPDSRVSTSYGSAFSSEAPHGTWSQGPKAQSSSNFDVLPERPVSRRKLPNQGPPLSGSRAQDDGSTASSWLRDLSITDSQGAVAPHRNGSGKDTEAGSSQVGRLSAGSVKGKQLPAGETPASIASQPVLKRQNNQEPVKGSQDSSPVAHFVAALATFFASDQTNPST